MDLQIIRTRHPPAAYGDDRLFLALDSEFLIGYAHLRVAHDLASEDTVELLDIIVSTELRRQGVGRRLMTAAETWASQADRAQLVLRADVVRSEALAFFSSLGYMQSGTSQEYVRDLDAARRAEAPTQPQ
jgi:ribosomal protein S18 acetylase RimI-like enzyme